MKKAKSWIVAEASKVFQGPVTDKVFERRLETCNACEHLERSSVEGQLGWCKACGCGRNARAELTVKGRMPKATCPRGLWENDQAPRAALPDTTDR